MSNIFLKLKEIKGKEKEKRHYSLFIEKRINENMVLKKLLNVYIRNLWLPLAKIWKLFFLKFSD